MTMLRKLKTPYYTFQKNKTKQKKQKKTKKKQKKTKKKEKKRKKIN